MLPKFGLVSPAKSGGHFNTRYFTPWTCHPTLAVTGSQCFAACMQEPNSVLSGITGKIGTSPAVVRIEHPMGEMTLTFEFECKAESVEFTSASLIRIAKLIATGEAMGPGSALACQ